MNANTITETGAIDMTRVASVSTPTVLDLIRELEQRLRVASLRIAIEGDDVIADVHETLEGLIALVREKLS